MYVCMYICLHALHTKFYRISHTAFLCDCVGCNQTEIWSDASEDVWYNAKEVWMRLKVGLWDACTYTYTYTYTYTNTYTHKYTYTYIYIYVWYSHLLCLLLNVIKFFYLGGSSQIPTMPLHAILCIVCMWCLLIPACITIHHVCVCIDVCNAYMCVYLCIDVRVVCIYVCVCMHVCMYVCVYIDVCIVCVYACIPPILQSYEAAVTTLWCCYR